MRALLDDLTADAPVFGRTTGADALGVSPVELLSSRAERTLLEFTYGDATPAVGSANDRDVHELQHRPLAEGV